MSIVCAKCHREFPGKAGISLKWCKVDEFYVCRRCWEKHCHEGHGKGEKNVGGHPLKTLIGVSVGVAMFISLVFLGINDISIRSDWDDIEPSPVSELEDGDVVRVEGTIDEPKGEVAISGHEYSTRSGHQWGWDGDDTFDFTDDTGTITTKTELYYEMEEGLHAAPNRDKTDGKVYEGGDEVIIIGEVVDEDGELTLYVRWLGENEEGMSPSLVCWVLTIIGSGLVVIPYLYLGSFWMRQKQKHESKVGHCNPIPISDIDHLLDPDVDWKENSKYTPEKKQKYIPICLSLAVVINLLGYLLFPPYHFEQYFGFAAAQMLILPFLVVMPFMSFIEFRTSGPNQMGVSKKGIHFYYEDPVQRYLNDDFIGWDEIKDIKYHSTGKTGYWGIDRENGVIESISGIKQKHREHIVKEWKEKYKKKKRPPPNINGNVFKTAADFLKSDLLD